MKMVLAKNITQSEVNFLTWDRKLPLDKKIAILKAHFNCPLDKVPFWDLYKAVKKFTS